MKKLSALTLGALVLITLSGCQFNIFAALDRIDIPSAAELNSKAGSDEGGFVSDVEDYIANDFLDNGDVTDEQVEAIVTNLETIYLAPPDVETGQKAAVLAGEIIINSDPVTSSVVNGVIGAVSDALSSGGTIDPDTLIGDIFPSDLDPAGLKNILDNLDRAASAYADLAPTLAGNDPGLTSGETGDMAQLAVVALVVSSIRHDPGVTGDNEILLAIQNGTSLSVTNNPFDPIGGSTYDSEIGDILTFSGLDLGI